MTIPEYIGQQPAERQAVLSNLHEALLANDTTVTPVIGSMMGKDMILYNEGKYMKYGLASVAKYMSFHCLPMYMNPPVHAKFEPLLPKAKFQKGCINFADAQACPVEVFTGLVKDVASVSITKLLEERDAARRKKK